MKLTQEYEVKTSKCSVCMNIYTHMYTTKKLCLLGIKLFTLFWAMFYI